jgi:hypothetical protein
MTSTDHPGHAGLGPIQMRGVVERATSRSAFRALIERDLSFPPVTFRERVIAGAEAWAPIIDGATPLERRALIVALGDALSTATPEGRTRAEDWHRSGTPRAGVGDEEAWIDERLQAYGDRSMVPRIVAALHLTPEPVRWAALMTVAFLSVGRDSIAWTSSALFVDQHDRIRARIIVLGPTADVDIILHEIAHVWHAPVLRELEEWRPALCTLGEIGIKALADLQGWRSRIADHEARHERLADGLAAAWLLAAAERDLARAPSTS